MTATPIPRTLQFSLMGARDLSILNTLLKIEDRSLQTRLASDKELIEDAINFEIEEVVKFFLFTIMFQVSIANFIRKICPSSKVKIVHGKRNPLRLKIF